MRPKSATHQLVSQKNPDLDAAELRQIARAVAALAQWKYADLFQTTQQRLQLQLRD